MQPSMFNLQVPLPDRNEVFLMNTFTDAQLLVSPDVAELMARAGEAASFTADEQETLRALVENGFIVENRDTERQALSQFFLNVREDRDQLRVTILTTLQC